MWFRGHTAVRNGRSILFLRVPPPEFCHLLAAARCTQWAWEPKSAKRRGNGKGGTRVREGKGVGVVYAAEPFAATHPARIPMGGGTGSSLAKADKDGNSASDDNPMAVGWLLFLFYYRPETPPEHWIPWPHGVRTSACAVFCCGL